MFRRLCAVLLAICFSVAPRVHVAMAENATAQCENLGLSIHPVYYGELFSNVRGGRTTADATQYQGLLDFALTVDFDKRCSPLPGKLFVLAQNTHGRGLTDDFVGDALVLSNIDSFDNIMRVSEYWWELSLLNDEVIVRLGKQDVNTEFFEIELAADFIQSTFGLSPSTAFPTYPNPSMGAVVLGQLHERVRLKMGVWDALASGGTWGFSGNDTVLIIGELEGTYNLLGGRLPGTIAVGAAYESAGELSGEPISPVHEYIFQIEQWIYQKSRCGEDDRQGLAIFAGYYPRFPGSQVTEDSIGDSVVAGLVCVGPLPGRDRDACGVGFARAELFQGGTSRETIVESFYKVQLTPRMSLQPDLQYISSPSGIYRDALVVGIRTVIHY